MGLTTGVEWSDATWNPWQGCTKVSPACADCYMFRDMLRYGNDPNVVRRSAERTFNLPLARNQRERRWKLRPGSKVFTCSWSDWFHVDADPWRPEAWEIVRRRHDLIFQIVTKRTGRIMECLPPNWGNGWPNVWLIATAEDQEWLDKRIGDLLSAPAAVHGLSIEPLLGPVSLVDAFHKWFNTLQGTMSATMPRLKDYLQWVIVGGESGDKARPTHSEWVRRLRDECLREEIPFFFKQWGEYATPSQIPGGVPLDESLQVGAVGLDGHIFGQNEPLPKNAGIEIVVRHGRKKTGRTLDGVVWSQFPGVKP